MTESVRIDAVERHDPRLEALITLQKAHALAHTPPGSGHAVEVGSTVVESITYWLAFKGDKAVGCIGLTALDEQRAEIKTMHVKESERGQGIAVLLVEHVLAHAQAEGFALLVLETGRSEGFAASRGLYQRMGFVECERFGPYREDHFSFCMARDL